MKFRRTRAADAEVRRPVLDPDVVAWATPAELADDAVVDRLLQQAGDRHTSRWPLDEI